MEKPNKQPRIDQRTRKLLPMRICGYYTGH
jgi:hypothetical protein